MERVIETTKIWINEDEEKKRTQKTVGSVVEEEKETRSCSVVETAGIFRLLLLLLLFPLLLLIFISTTFIETNNRINFPLLMLVFCVCCCYSNRRNNENRSDELFYSPFFPISFFIFTINPSFSRAIDIAYNLWLWHCHSALFTIVVVMHFKYYLLHMWIVYTYAQVNRATHSMKQLTWILCACVKLDDGHFLWNDANYKCV